MSVDRGKWFHLFIVVLFLASCTKSYTKEQIEKLFEPITSKYGIRIVYEIDNNFLSSDETIVPVTGPSKRSVIKPIDHSDLARYPELLQKAFNKYPVQMIKKHLSAIHFAKEINEDGFKYGGSYDAYRRVIYLVNDGRQSDMFSIYAFHHEFSSILLNRHGFFLNPWIDENPKGFKYLYTRYGGTDNTLKHLKFTGESTEADFESGFLTDYGRTNFENDFNEYAAMIFTHPQKFKKIMDQYPRVRGKFLLLLDFYHKIDPIFTEAYLLGEK